MLASAVITVVSANIGYDSGSPFAYADEAQGGTAEEPAGAALAGAVSRAIANSGSSDYVEALTTQAGAEQSAFDIPPGLRLSRNVAQTELKRFIDAEAELARRLAGENQEDAGNEPAPFRLDLKGLSGGEETDEPDQPIANSWEE